MNQTKKVIVISNAFLLSSGIQNLLLEIRGMLVEHVFTGSEKRLIDKIISIKPEYVIIDPYSITNILIKIVRELREESDIKVIGLVSSVTDKKVASLFSYTLDTECNKYDLVETLKKIVGPHKKSDSENEQVLSKRETEILRTLVLGLTNQEVANKLFLSIHTVMTHRKKITRKLGIKTVSGLTVYALMNNIVDIREVERSL